MNCLKCERAMEPLLIGDPPTDGGLVNDGGLVTVSFGYGSSHDMDQATAFVCDDCYATHHHLFRVTSSPLGGPGRSGGDADTTLELVVP